MNILTPEPIGYVYTGNTVFMQWVKTFKWSLVIVWLLFLSIAWTIYTYNMEQSSGAVAISGFIGSAIMLAPLVLMMPIVFQMNMFQTDCYCWIVLLVSSAAASYAILFAGTQPFTLWVLGLVLHSMAYIGLLLYAYSVWTDEDINHREYDHQS